MHSIKNIQSEIIFLVKMIFITPQDYVELYIECKINLKYIVFFFIFHVPFINTTASQKNASQVPQKY